MSALFCRRLRMELELSRVPLEEPSIPNGFRWEAWSPELLERHAIVKYRSFQNEADGALFQSLRELKGCRQLMEYIAASAFFLPRTTWLLIAPDGIECGTIQGLATIGDWGAIQNVGIAPDFRRQGLGRSLVQKALIGFQDSGITNVSLEVTTVNLPAIRLYESLGFVRTKTLFRDAT